MVSFLANANSTIQRASDDHIRGRVMSIYSMLFLGMTPAGSLIIGLVSESVST
ncbi:MAG: MFS transporter, partial [Nitrospirae bacterium]